MNYCSCHCRRRDVVRCIASSSPKHEISFFPFHFDILTLCLHSVVIHYGHVAVHLKVDVNICVSRSVFRFRKVLSFNFVSRSLAPPVLEHLENKNKKLFQRMCFIRFASFAFFLSRKPRLRHETGSIRINARTRTSCRHFYRICFRCLRGQNGNRPCECVFGKYLRWFISICRSDNIWCSEYVTILSFRWPLFILFLLPPVLLLLNWQITETERYAIWIEQTTHMSSLIQTNNTYISPLRKLSSMLFYTRFPFSTAALAASAIQMLLWGFSSCPLSYFNRNPFSLFLSLCISLDSLCHTMF